MNFQEKVFETTAELRARAVELADVALTQARATATRAAQRVQGLKGSLAVLRSAGQDLNVVARRHVTRFVKENRTIAVAAGKDLQALARSTFATFTQKPAVARKPRKLSARKRPASAKAA